MARAKKEAVLTPEERLQAALVPDWEWPYKLPENWCWTTVGAINQYVGSSIDPMKSGNEHFELYSVPSSADDYPEIVFGAEIGSTKQAVEKSDVLLCKINPRINRVWKVSKHTEHTLLASSEWIVVRNSKFLSDYLMWCFRSQYFREYMLSNVSGVGGSLMRAQPKYVQGYPIPVPPFAEQQRIVDRIESLFAKLDEAKEKAQTVLDSFETRKAAILHKAFTGELTAKWRDEHGVGMESWENKSIQSVCSMKITDGTHQTPIYCECDEGYPFISAKDVTTGKICWDNVKYIIPSLHEELYGRVAPQVDDILLAKNGTTGVAAIVDTNKVFDIYVTLAVLRPNKEIIVPRYLLNIVNSPICKNQFDNRLKGIGVPNLHLKEIKEVLINVPSLDEQAVIAQIVDELIASEQQAKEVAEDVLDRIDLIKKSILARAFRGEFGTNDPTDEPAVELLKKVLDLPAEPKPVIKRKYIPKELDAQIKTDLERKIIKLYIQNETEILSINQIMNVSSKKFDVLETLRNLQNRGILIKENDLYKLVR